MKKYFLFACVALFCSGATMATEDDLVANAKDIGPAVEETKLAETMAELGEKSKKSKVQEDVRFPDLSDFFDGFDLLSKSLKRKAEGGTDGATVQQSGDDLLVYDGNMRLRLKVTAANTNGLINFEMYYPTGEKKVTGDGYLNGRKVFNLWDQQGKKLCEAIVRKSKLKDDSDITCYYDNNEKEERWYKNGDVIHEGSYVNDKKEGEWYYYYEKDKLKEIAHYKNGLLNGQNTGWYFNGKTKFVDTYQDGNLVEASISYYPDGAVEYISDYTKGYRCFYREDGSVAMEADMKQFNCHKYDIPCQSNMRSSWLLDGKGIEYFENGQIKEEANFKLGQVDGKRTMYYTSGELWQELTFKDGKLEGLQKIYCKNGQLHGESTYKDGKEDGDWVVYYANGQVQEKGQYKDGKRVGEWKFYDKNGQETENPDPIEAEC